MAFTILAESYLMAYGWARIKGASDMTAHLFARNFDVPVTAKQVEDAWNQPAPSGRPWSEVNR